MKLSTLIPNLQGQTVNFPHWQFGGCNPNGDKAPGKAGRFWVCTSRSPKPSQLLLLRFVPEFENPGYPSKFAFTNQRGLTILVFTAHCYFCLTLFKKSVILSKPVLLLGDRDRIQAARVSLLFPCRGRQTLPDPIRSWNAAEISCLFRSVPVHSHFPNSPARLCYRLHRRSCPSLTVSADAHTRTCNRHVPVPAGAAGGTHSFS